MPSKTDHSKLNSNFNNEKNKNKTDKVQPTQVAHENWIGYTKRKNKLEKIQHTEMQNNVHNEHRIYIKTTAE